MTEHLRYTANRLRQLSIQKLPKAIVLAFVTAGLFIIRDAVLLQLFSFGVAEDSSSYLTVGSYLRTVPYALVNTLIDTTHHPLALIWFQIVLAAFAAGLLIYVLAQKHVIPAIAVGILLFFDIAWASTNRWILTESFFVSFHLISLACLIAHYRRRGTLCFGELALAGVLYAWTATIRPSGVLLLLPILVTYFWLTRSWRRTAWVLTGMAGLLLASSLLNFATSGAFKLSDGTGLYVGFPLFSYHLFAADNGPVSARLDHDLRTCFPDLDYSQITIANSNTYLWQKFKICLNNQTDPFLPAYVEAITKRPVFFVEQIIRQNVAFLSARPVKAYTYWLPAGDHSACSAYAWCDQSRQQAQQQPYLKRVVSDLASAITDVTIYADFVYKLPLSTWPLENLERRDALPAAQTFTVAIWIILSLGLLYIARDELRFIALACLGFIAYTALSVTVGHVFIERYAQVLAPFYAILAVIIVTTAVQLFRRGGVYRQAVGVSASLPAVIVVGCLGLNISSDLSQRHITDWLVNQVDEHEQLVTDFYLEDVRTLASTWIEARDWKWLVRPLEPKVTSDALSQGIHYLLLDERSCPTTDFAACLEAFVQHGATVVYQSDSLLGLVPRRAILWTFRPQHPLNLTFDNALQLIGYNVFRSPEGKVNLLLHWYTRQTSHTTYTAFVHAADPRTGAILQQADAPLGKGFHLTHTWRTNELVFESIELPCPAQPSPCYIRFGLYQAENGMRATIRDANHNDLGDHIDILP